MTDPGFAVLAAVDKAAGKMGATLAQVALSWLAHRPGITAPIASATSVSQLKELMSGIELRLAKRRLRNSSARTRGARAEPPGAQVRDIP
jgi:aryl-alcohol dehydrogenase-like predicted oxidoreductase